MKKIIPLAIFFIVTACNNKVPNLQKRKIGNYLVEAIYINDKIEGVAKTYNEDGILVSISNYQNGKKEGKTVNYFKNGLSKDSIHFSDGMRNGYEFNYNEAGDLVSIGYSYYGLQMGPQIVMSKGVVQEYYFMDFNKEDLINCKYDSSGNLAKIIYYSLRMRMSDVLKDGNKMSSLLVYMPQPPGAIVKFKVGIKRNNKDYDLFEIKTDKVFLDTILPRLSFEENYFVVADVLNKDSSINTSFIEEFSVSKN